MAGRLGGLREELGENRHHLGAEGWSDGLSDDFREVPAHGRGLMPTQAALTDWACAVIRKGLGRRVEHRACDEVGHHFNIPTPLRGPPSSGRADMSSVFS